MATKKTTKKTTNKPTTAKPAPKVEQKPVETPERPRLDRLSLIIPNYNNGENIGKLLDNLIDQKMRSNREVEIIVVDDGSTDSSREVIDGFGLIQKIYQENKGVSAARNAGIEASNGKYIAFLDSDDNIEPRYIEAIFKEMDSGCDYCAYPWKDADTGETVMYAFNMPLPAYAVWAYSFRYDCIGKERFNENMNVGEDREWLERVLPGKKRKLSDEIIYRYSWNANENSLSKRHNRGELPLERQNV